MEFKRLKLIFPEYTASALRGRNPWSQWGGFNQARCWKSHQVAISAARAKLAPLPAKVRNCGTGEKSPGGDCCAGPAASARKGQKVPFLS